MLLPPKEDMVTPRAAAELLGCTPQTVRRYIQEKRLRAWTRGTGRYVLSRSEVLALVEEVTPDPLPASRAEMLAGHKAAEAALRRAGVKW